jgi:hypothetical protein
MDVTGIIAELRSELQEIDQTILSLEGSNRVGIGATAAQAQSLVEIRRGRKPDGGPNASTPASTQTVGTVSRVES